VRARDLFLWGSGYVPRWLGGACEEGYLHLEARIRKMEGYPDIPEAPRDGVAEGVPRLMRGEALYDSRGLGSMRRRREDA
jgi:hypothetical protein